MNHLRVAVIGTGTMGAQALWQLSQQSCEVVGYELYKPGHSRGAAAGENRVFTFIEMADSREVPIIERADQLYKQLEAESGVQLRDLQGVLVISEESSEASRIALENVKLDPDRYQVLKPTEARVRFPKFDILDDELAIFDLGGGVIFPERTVQTAAALAVENGASLRRESRVIRIEQHSDQVFITTEDQQTEAFDRVVVAAGPWISQLLPDMKQYFAIRRLISTWFRPKFRESMDGLSGYIRTVPNYSYGVPSPDGTSLKVGLGFPHHQAVESPDSTESNLSDEDLEPFRNLVRDLFPTLEDYPVRFGLCHESYTESRTEWVQPHPEMQNVLVMAGFSGKGFRTSPAHGEIAARWAMGLEPEPYAAFLFEMEHRQF